MTAFVTAALRVIQPGLQSTLQDIGRHGFQRLGIPVSGGLDWISLKAANLLVGNPAGTAAVEISLLGPILEVEADSVRMALAGTTASLEVSDPATGETLTLPSLTSITLRRGQRLRLGGFGDAAVAYLAVEGGFAIEPVMGSLSVHWRAQTGPLEGRKLAAGDRLPLALARAPDRAEVRLTASDLAAVGPYRAGAYRVVLGPQDDKFTAAQIETFLTGAYQVSREADRWGLRLDGPLLTHTISIVSDAIAPGAIQVPGGGQPLVLLADRATTGGYPKIATVISADLPRIGRSTPGAGITFVAVTVEEAEAARRSLETQMTGLAERLEPVRHAASLDAGRLSSLNLISGVTDGSPA